MAKKDADLFDRLRQVGLRKQAAKALSGVSDTAGKQAQRAARAAVSELRAVADEIERRLPAAAPASGSSGESSAATSRARARTPRSTKASAARTQKAGTAKPRRAPRSSTTLGQVADPAHGQRRRLRRVPSARHRRRIRQSRRPRPVPSPTHRGRIRHRRRRGDLKPHTSGALAPPTSRTRPDAQKHRNRGEVLAVELVTWLLDAASRRRAVRRAARPRPTGRSLSTPCLRLGRRRGRRKPSGSSPPRPALLPLRRTNAAAPRLPSRTVESRPQREPGPAPSEPLLCLRKRASRRRRPARCSPCSGASAPIWT